MKNTFKLISVSLILLISTVANAQSVTKMTINVSVKSGATVNLHDEFDIKYTGFKDDISSIYVSEGAIELLTPAETDLLVSQVQAAELVNEFGEHIMIQNVDQNEQKSDGRYLLSFRNSIDCVVMPRGTYEGEYRTSIEYL